MIHDSKWPAQPRLSRCQLNQLSMVFFCEICNDTVRLKLSVVEITLCALY